MKQSTSLFRIPVSKSLHMAVSKRLTAFYSKCNYSLSDIAHLPKKCILYSFLTIH